MKMERLKVKWTPIADTVDCRTIIHPGHYWSDSRDVVDACWPGQVVGSVMGERCGVDHDQAGAARGPVHLGLPLSRTADRHTTQPLAVVLWHTTILKSTVLSALLLSTNTSVEVWRRANTPHKARFAARSWWTLPSSSALSIWSLVIAVELQLSELKSSGSHWWINSYCTLVIHKLSIYCSCV